jgi:hypothetical protein
MIAATVLAMWKNEEAYEPGRARPIETERDGQGRGRRIEA